MASKRKKGGKNAGLTIPKKPQSLEEKRTILAGLSKEVQRINVVDEKGKTKWRPLADLRDEDIIIFKSDGTPNVQRGEPGRRPQKKVHVDIKPANAMVEELGRQRQKFLANDPLRRSIEGDFESVNVLRQVMLKLAESAASIEFEIGEAVRLGTPVSQLARRHSIILTSLRDASVKRIEQKLKNQEVDLESSAFRAIFVLVVETLRDAMVRSGVDAEMISLVLSEFASEVETEEWRSKALQGQRGDAAPALN